MAHVRPLTNSQKMFLQRFMASHVLTDDALEQLYTSIRDRPLAGGDGDDDNDGDESRRQAYMGRDLAHCLGILNDSLGSGFNMEVRTVSLPRPYDPDRNDDEDGGDDESARRSSRAGGGRGRLIKYHALVNKTGDVHAQKYASPLALRGPHELAYFRLVFERLVESGVEWMDDDNNKVGCPGALNMMNLINLRTELEGPHADKLSVGQTERALGMLTEEGWLVPTAPTPDPDSDDDEGDKGADEEKDENEQGDDDGDNDDDGEGDGDDESSARNTRKKRSLRNKNKSSPSPGGKKKKRRYKRKSLSGAHLGIGPRALMELGEMLVEMGLPRERMPQFILHSA